VTVNRDGCPNHRRVTFGQRIGCRGEVSKPVVCVRPLALMSLLACPLGPVCGLGGQVRAGIIGSSLTGRPSHLATQWSVLIHEVVEGRFESALLGGAASDGTTSPAGAWPQAPARRLVDECSPAGASSPVPSPAGSAVQPPALALSHDHLLDDPQHVGRLFLDLISSLPEAFPSRLFRPPRWA
jgi:hypothetical protein